MFEVMTLKDNLSQGFDPLSIGLNAIIQALNGLFGSANPGHYEGGRFIPGDLEQRKSYTATRINSYGVAAVVDGNIIYDILTEVAPAPYNQGGNWQGNLDSYLGTLKRDLESGKIIPDENNNFIKKYGQTTGGGFAYNVSTFGNFLPLAVIGGGLFLLLSTKKKKRKK